MSLQIPQILSLSYIFKFKIPTFPSFFASFMYRSCLFCVPICVPNSTFPYMKNKL